MNSIKVVVRQIGVAHKGLNVQSAEEVSDYLETNYVANGYLLQATHYLGDVLNEQKGIQGYKVMFVFVLPGTPELPVVGGSELVGEGVVPAKKRGRPVSAKA